MFLVAILCTECGSPHEPGAIQTVCTSCGAPLEARYDLDRVRSSVSRAELAARTGGMWRFREALPLPEGARVVSLGEGGTPLLPLPRIGSALGIQDLFLKDEALNPTGSFKARGMSVAVSMAKLLGAKALCAPSAGNAGGALAAYGARAGLPVHLAMPKGAPLINRMEAEVAGAHVTLVDGNISDCGRWMAERAAEMGWYPLTTLREPYRVEGKKTMGYELALQLGWALPEVILYPTGGGTGLVGMWKAFHEMRKLGWLPAEAGFPRMVAVQAEGCAPIVEAFHAGARRAVVPEAAETLASGLLVPSPIGDRWMLRVLRESGGTAVSVPDPVLLAASRRLASTEGIFPAPEAGSLLAAAESLREAGWIRGPDRVVLFNTGSGLKYPECFEAG